MVFSKGSFCMRVHYSISICFRLLAAGWYVVIKGKIRFVAFFICLRADGLEAKLTPERDLSMIAFGRPLLLRRCLNSQGSPEELVPSILIASPLMKPFLTPGGWHELKCAY